MTVGFPDYGRQTPTAGAQLLVVDQVVNAQLVTPTAFCGNYPFINVSALGGANTDQYDVEVTFIQGPGLVTFQFPYRVTFGGGWGLAVQVPVLTNWFFVTIIPKAGNDAQALVMTFTGSQGYSPRLHYSGALGNGVEIQSNQSWNAAEIKTFFTNVVHNSDAVFSIQQSTNNKWHAILRYYDISTNTFIIFAQIEGAAEGQSWNGHILLPAAPIQLDVTNDDTVAHVMKVSVVV